MANSKKLRKLAIRDAQVHCNLVIRSFVSTTISPSPPEGWSAQQHLKGVPDKAADPSDPVVAPAPSHARSRIKRRRKAGSHTPRFNLGRELHRVSGVDLTRIDGIDVSVAQTLISEVGLDMARWQDEHHFASWLGLCPDKSDHGRESDSLRYPTRDQSRGDRAPNRRHHASPQPELPRRPVPPVPRQARPAQSHHAHGP
jgi:hypothetical protein